MQWWPVLLLVVVEYVRARITCRGLSGEAVDWFVIYKPPTPTKSLAKYFYMDGSQSNWTLSPLTIDNDAAAVGATLRDFYKHDERQFSFAYNDDSPSGAVDSYRGHSKGVVVFDEETGFWIIHSVPNFPSIASYSYPATGMKFGQTFLCLTLSTHSLGDVGEHLRYVQATPFFSNLPQHFSLRFPVLINIMKKQSLSKSETIYTRVRQFTTIGGQSLKSFAKHKKFNKDLWFDFVAPELRINMAVQSWLNGGADDLSSTCGSRTSVYDVTSVALPGISFNSSRDHSKWGVADSKGPNIVCIGDLNRQKSQLRRGGGAVCLLHRGLWNSFHSSVNSVQPCVSKRTHSYCTSSHIIISIVLSVLWAFIS